jgi:hypothetical protein
LQINIKNTQLKRGKYTMAKTHLNYEQRLNRLIHEKNLAMSHAWDKGDMEKFWELSDSVELLEDEKSKYLNECNELVLV